MITPPSTDGCSTPSTASAEATWFAAVAVPRHLDQLLDYRGTGPEPLPGQQVRVPLGSRQVIGVVCAVREASAHAGPLRDVLAILADRPSLPVDILDLALWAARYYHHPIGEVLSGLLHAPPPATRAAVVWNLVDGAAAPDPRLAPARARAYAALATLGRAATTAELTALGIDAARRRDLEQQGLIYAATPSAPPRIASYTAPMLTADQAAAVARIEQQPHGFHAYLLDGVTGSGKTEVYLRLIHAHISRGAQALVLVPEIGLTPQTLSRITERFPRTAALHSALADGERAAIWQRARDGKLDVVIGTRSAVFTPLPRLGLIVVDEEHDTSFKQQEGFRYHARDLAVKRARDANLPIVLGSATPALETLANVQRGRFQVLHLHARPGAARLPRLTVLDVRGVPLTEGMSEPLLRAIGERIARGEQALLFVNRRGYAPTLLCTSCGWLAECSACDARLTAHANPRALICHHCDHRAAWPASCPQCSGSALQHRGFGTERVEQALAERFPDTAIARIDRDAARSEARLTALLDRARRGDVPILVGTQMLAKGHHFPGVTLSAVLGADGGLLSADFRAPERTAQLIVQVAGRAGRGEVPGELWLQTYRPDHPVVRALRDGGYHAFAEYALAERAAALLPPYAAMALVRADGIDATRTRDALLEVREALRADPRTRAGQVGVHGPVAAPLARRNTRFRFQLALLAAERAALHTAATRARSVLERLDRRHVRAGIDIDPIDAF